MLNTQYILRGELRNNKENSFINVSVSVCVKENSRPAPSVS